MGETDERGPSMEEVYQEMEVLEPYTTGELASSFETSTGRIRRLLERLSTSDRIRKKAPASDRPIWIRTAPSYECPNCGNSYEVRFLHPVLAPVQFCPRCGNRLPSE